MSKQVVRLKFKVNDLKRNDPRLAKVALTRAGVNELKSAAKEIGQDLIIQKIRESRSDIKAYVEQDLAQYTDRALKFFLNQRSPNSTVQPKRGRAFFTQRNITFSDTDNYNQTFRSNNARATLSRNPNPKVTVSWASLAPTTIQRKKKEGKDALRFYFDTGTLASVLTQRVGKAFKDILNFDIRVVKDKTIRVQALPSSALNRAGLAGLGNLDNPLASSGNNRQIVNFLKISQSAASERLIQKLSNTGRSRPDQPRKERPFLQPVLGYWLIRRFPNVFTKAIAEYV